MSTAVLNYILIPRGLAFRFSRDNRDKPLAWLLLIRAGHIPGGGGGTAIYGLYRYVPL